MGLAVNVFLNFCELRPPSPFTVLLHVEEISLQQQPPCNSIHGPNFFSKEREEEDHEGVTRLLLENLQ